METAKKRQKWINLALCFMMIFVCLGFCSSNKSLYLAATCEALGVKRTVFSLSSSCRFITTAIVNVFFGALVARFGTKKLIGAGFLFLIASVLLKAYSPDVELFYVSEVLSGIGFSLSGTGMVGCVVSRWSPENKGTIMGAILCANGIGGAVAAQIVTPMINNESNIFGYQDAYKLVALLLVVTMTVFLVLFREKPKGATAEAVVSGKKKASRGRGWAGIPYERAVRLPCFYVALVCIFFTGFCLQGIGGISTTHMQDVGLTPDFVALVASISSLCLTGSKFLSGFLYDKLGLRKASGLCCAAAVLSMLCLGMVVPNGLLKGLAPVYGVLSAIALPLETVMLPLYAADLFGDRSFDRIVGLFISVNTAGYAVGTPFVNLGFDVTGSYRGVLFLTAGIMLAMTVAMQFVITAAHKMRTQIPETEAMS